MQRIAIFASGSGTNAEALIKHFNKKEGKPARVALVLSNKKDAFVLKRAKKLDVPHITFGKKELVETDKVLAVLRDYQINWIVLAGFLLKIPVSILREYEGRIVNIHPALLPEYGGKGMYGDKVHRAVIDAGEEKSGITIHYVNENYDEGEIIFQASCKVESGDTAGTLADKVHELEHRHYPEVVEDTIRKEVTTTS